MTGVTVERLYRVTIGDTAHLLGGEDALSLAKGIVTALGLTPQLPAAADYGAIVADITPPAHIESGPAAEEAAIAPTSPTEEPAPVAVTSPADGSVIAPEATRDAGDPSTGSPAAEDVAPPLKMGNWDEDIPELRRLHAEGLPLREIAARLNRPWPATSTKAIGLGLRRNTTPDAPVPEPAQVAPPEPTNAPPEPPKPTATTFTPVEPILDRPGDAAPVVDWSAVETSALIREMGPAGGGLTAAARMTGHSISHCALRWQHLKEAGTTRVEDYARSQEAWA